MMPVRSNTAVFYFLIVALLLNVPFAGFHSVEHIHSNASVVDAHAHDLHSHDSHSQQHSPFSLSLSTEEASDKQPQSDVHVCHICQLTGKLTTLIPHQASIPLPRLSAIQYRIHEQRYPGFTTLEFFAIRGPPITA